MNGVCRSRRELYCECTKIAHKCVDGKLQVDKVASCRHLLPPLSCEPGSQLASFSLAPLCSRPTTAICVSERGRRHKKPPCKMESARSSAIVGHLLSVSIISLPLLPASGNSLPLSSRLRVNHSQADGQNWHLLSLSHTFKSSKSPQL